MTVKELIEELQKRAPDDVVEAECSMCSYCTELADVGPKGRAFPHTTIIS